MIEIRRHILSEYDIPINYVMKMYVRFSKIGQSDLGLEQRQYYFNESKHNVAYRQFIHDLATALTNDTTMIVNDVREIYEFEKKISLVRMLRVFHSFEFVCSFIGRLLNNEHDKMKPFERRSAISLESSIRV